MKYEYMKRGLLLAAAVLVLGASASSVSAYDGSGSGFPPGQVGNPNPPHRFVCDFVIHQLPFNRTVWLPRCRVVKSTDTTNVQGKNIGERINELLTRIRLGHS